MQSIDVPGELGKTRINPHDAWTRVTAATAAGDGAWWPGQEFRWLAVG